MPYTYCNVYLLLIFLIAINGVSQVVRFWIEFGCGLASMRRSSWREDAEEGGRRVPLLEEGQYYSLNQLDNFIFLYTSKVKSVAFLCIIYSIYLLCALNWFLAMLDRALSLILLGVGYSHLMPAEDSSLAPFSLVLPISYSFWWGVGFIQQAT